MGSRQNERGMKRHRCSNLNQVEVSEVGQGGRKPCLGGGWREFVETWGDPFPHLGGAYTSVFVIIHSVEHLCFMYFSICMSYFAIKDCKKKCQERQHNYCHLALSSFKGQCMMLTSPLTWVLLNKNLREGSSAD